MERKNKKKQAYVEGVYISKLYKSQVADFDNSASSILRVFEQNQAKIYELEKTAKDITDEMAKIQYSNCVITMNVLGKRCIEHEIENDEITTTELCAFQDLDLYIEKKITQLLELKTKLENVTDNLNSAFARSQKTERKILRTVQHLKESQKQINLKYPTLKYSTIQEKIEVLDQALLAEQKLKEADLKENEQKVIEELAILMQENNINESQIVSATEEQRIENEFGFELLRDYILVGNSVKNVSCISYDDLSNVLGELDINGIGLVTAVENQELNRVLVTVNSGTSIFLFDTKKFERICNVTVTRQPLGNIKLTDDAVLLLEMNTLELFSFKQQQVFHKSENTTFGRFLVVNKTSHPNEVVLGCEKGLTFAIVDHENSKIEYPEESYLKNEVVQGVIEYKKDTLFVATYRLKYLAIIDRTQKAITRQIDSSNYNFMQFHLVQIPTVKIEELPFVFLRNQKELMLIDLKSNAIIKLLDCNYPFDNWVYNQVKAQVNENDEIEIYGIEQNLGQLNLKKVTLVKHFLRAVQAYSKD